MYTVKELLIEKSVNRFIDENEVTYGFRVLGRGEHVFFQEQDKGLICEFDTVNRALYTKSIQNWSGYKEMDKSERERVVSAIYFVYKKLYNKEINLI